MHGDRFKHINNVARILLQETGIGLEVIVIHVHLPNSCIALTTILHLKLWQSPHCCIVCDCATAQGDYHFQVIKNKKKENKTLIICCICYCLYVVNEIHSHTPCCARIRDFVYKYWYSIGILIAVCSVFTVQQCVYSLVHYGLEAEGILCSTGCCRATVSLSGNCEQ